MSQYTISPTEKLSGEVFISGSKNASLPIMAAALLSSDISTIKNIPALSDTENMCELIKTIGGTAVRNLDNSVSISLSGLKRRSAPYEIANKLRASVLLMGAILARVGRVRIPLPGGCQIGTRPIDLHLKGFAAMGAKLKQGHGYVEAKCGRLMGAKIYLDFPSVGATENLLIAACLARGETIIENAATEPEVVDLASFLNKMGAKITNAGNDTITIIGCENGGLLGKSSLHACNYTVIPDRIEAGTFMTIAAICKSELTLCHVVPAHLKPLIAKFQEMGITVEVTSDKIKILPVDKFHAVDIKTLPYPGFPTDMQSQFMALMSVADGTGVVVETIFENRFMQVPELCRMGAKIKIDGRSAMIDGTKKL
ncbi:MAG: UDP-N-acetylglucosamine 1-carboxyvinyltransferase, partial [Oscillospiraceae bacterium]